MKKKYIVGIDQSTSGTKIVLVNEQGHIEYIKTKEHKQYYPNPGWVEHDPEEIFENCLCLLKECFLFADKNEYFIEGVSITNQRETVVFWDDKTKKPLCNAIVWQCKRSTQICNDLKNLNYSKLIEEKTGLHLDPYFSASKIKWVLDNDLNVMKSVKEKSLKIGTIDAWLIYKMTNNQVFKTDHTNASRTMLYNINTHSWDVELLNIFGVKKYMLPTIHYCNEIYGKTDKEIVGKSIAIAGVIGDSQGALFGQQCFLEGMGKATYGTGSSILLYIGDKQIRSSKGILTSIAWGIDGKIQYALEGVINSSGDTLKWLKDNMEMYVEDTEIDGYIDSVDSTEGVYIIPAFVGLGAPYWKPEAKASIVGITRKTTKAHVIRAAIESMAYQVADLIQVMNKEANIPLRCLNVDGGPTKNSFLMQLQADLIQKNIITSKYQELSVLGAVYLGGLALKIWENIECLKQLESIDKEYTPTISEDKAIKMICDWQQAIINHT